MTKVSREELSSRINDLEIDDDVKISLMEDITDSISPDESEELTRLKTEMEDLKGKYEDVKAKYKERFYTATESPNKEDFKEEELEEKKVVDVKEI